MHVISDNTITAPLYNNAYVNLEIFAHKNADSAEKNGSQHNDMYLLSGLQPNKQTLSADIFYILYEEEKEGYHLYGINESDSLLKRAQAMWTLTLGARCVVPASFGTEGIMGDRLWLQCSGLLNSAT